MGFMSWIFSRHKKQEIAEEQERLTSPLPTDHPIEHPVLMPRIQRLRQESAIDDQAERENTRRELRRLEAQKMISLERRLMTRRRGDPH